MTAHETNFPLHRQSQCSTGSPSPPFAPSPPVPLAASNVSRYPAASVGCCVARPWFPDVVAEGQADLRRRMFYGYSSHWSRIGHSQFCGLSLVFSVGTSDSGTPPVGGHHGKHNFRASSPAMGREPAQPAIARRIQRKEAGARGPHRSRQYAG